MKRLIFKYPLMMLPIEDVLMPKDAQILAAQWQMGTVKLWALIDARVPIATVSRRILIVPTGAEVDMEPTDQYINTVQGNGFVWHIFERTRP